MSILDSSAADRHFSVYNFYLFSALLLLEMLLSFSISGYFHIPPISFTVAYLPIIISAVCLRIRYSVLLGMFFGIISAYKASSFYVMPADMIFSPLRSGMPVQSLILSVGTRMLFAFIIASAFRLAEKSRYRYYLIFALGAVAPVLHAALVYQTIGTLFPEIGINISRLDPLAPNKLGKDLMFAILSVSVLRVHRSKTMMFFKEGVDRYRTTRLVNIWIAGLVFMVFMIMMGFGFYFASRMKPLLNEYDIFVSENMSHDILHFLLQSSLTALSICLLLVVVLLAGYRYMAYHRYLSDLDALTNVLGRRSFFEKCAKIKAKNTDGSDKQWSLLIDVDHFKQVNDNYGHVQGDAVLAGIAGLLEQYFSHHGLVGRIGGDEFAVMLLRPLSPQKLCAILDDFFSALKKMPLPSQMAGITLSCSIGALQCDPRHDMQEVMSKADKLLYMVKDLGRAGFIVGTDDGQILVKKTGIVQNTLPVSS